MKATREEVYKVIDGEREYQEKRWERPAHIHSNLEYLVYIEHYVNQAKTLSSTKDDKEVAPDVKAALRKIAALAVAAMEENGTQARELSI